MPIIDTFLPLTGGTISGDLTVQGTTLVRYSTFDIDAGEALAASASTGVFKGGTITANATNPKAVDIAATTGYVLDYTTDTNDPILTRVETPAQTVELTSGPGGGQSRVVTWWVISKTGAVVQLASRPTNTQRRDYIQVGVTAYDPVGGALFVVQPRPNMLTQDNNQLFDLFHALGPFSTDGNNVSPNGANLKFNKSLGRMFAPSFSHLSTPKDPHSAVNPAAVAAAFRYATQAPGSQSAQVTDIDVANYDVAGVVTPVPGGPTVTTIHRVYLFATQLPSEQLAVQYGQVAYPTINDAMGALGNGSFVPNPEFTDNGTLVAYVLATKSCTDLSDVTNCVIIKAGKFATP